VKPLISYLITVYNKERELPETIKCLRNQQGLEGAELEFVFVDDCSSDNSVALLQAEARRDPRLRVIENSVNRGPSIRINQAAQNASGSYFIPVDADDFLTTNGTRVLLDIAGDKGAPLVFGASKRGYHPDAQLNKDALITVAKDPLAYCARKQIVHMGFLADAQLWHNAGGADERIFIQDQSLPLNLSATASRLAYIHDVVYWLRPQASDNLSINKTQQHHDRFFSALYQLEKANISMQAKHSLFRQVISSRWKLQRDRNRISSYFTEEFLRYLQSKVLFANNLSQKRISHYSTEMKLLNGVRRNNIIG